MKPLELNGKTFQVKTSAELMGDWRLVFNVFERVAVEPDQLIPEMRRLIVTIAPRAARDAQRWSDGEVLIAGGAIFKHIALCVTEFRSAMDAFQRACGVLAALFNDPGESSHA